MKPPIFERTALDINIFQDRFESFIVFKASLTRSVTQESDEIRLHCVCVCVCVLAVGVSEHGAPVMLVLSPLAVA